MKAGAFLALLLAAGVLPAIAAEPPADSPAPGPADSTPFKVEIFKGVQILKGPSDNLYPRAEVFDGREGWAVLNLMVDPTGKPYEVMVVDSSGNPAFEKAALSAVNQVTFQPARRGDTPIDSSFTFKFKFAIRDMAKGASNKFVSEYRRFTKAIEAGDKAQADLQLAGLEPQNLYEDAFANFGKFHYHRKWGTPAEQLVDLQRAIAGEEKSSYLPKDAFAIALYAKFKLEAAGGDYGSALDTWETLRPVATADMREEVQRVVEKIQALQAGSQAVRLSATIQRHNSWTGTLFRNRFSVAVKSGKVSEIKLRCAQQYLFFPYQPDVQYSIGTKKDHCGIEVVGDPGTTFDLIQ